MKTMLKLFAVNQTSLAPGIDYRDHLVLVKQIDAECFLSFTGIRVDPKDPRYVYLNAEVPKPLQPSIRFQDLYRVCTLMVQFNEHGTRTNKQYSEKDLRDIRDVFEFFALAYKMLGCFDNHVRIEWSPHVPAMKQDDTASDEIHRIRDDEDAPVEQAAQTDQGGYVSPGYVPFDARMSSVGRQRNSEDGF